jgi:UDP-N-acetylglucosamine 2-epimerase (non-hydrolysing)
MTSEKLERGEWPGLSSVELDPTRPLVAVTAHRRESFGDAFISMCRAFRMLAEEDGAQIVYPVHPNPNVRRAVDSVLRGVAGVHLIEPLDYVPFVDLLRRARIILTDSGGIQEEAPSLEKPVLVMRETTERPEALETGWAELVGTQTTRIVEAARARLRGEWRAPVTGIMNPFGDGRASIRIADAIVSFLKA